MCGDYPVDKGISIGSTLEAMLTNKYIRSVFRHWVPLLTGTASLIYGSIGEVWGKRPFFIALEIIGVFLLFYAGFRTWKDSLFNPLIDDIEQIAKYLQKIEYETAKESEEMKQATAQSLNFPLSELPAKIEHHPHKRLFRFECKLTSHKERAELLLSSSEAAKCLTHLLPLFNGMPSPILQVKEALELYKQSLIKVRDDWH